jgi:hypothetical protein
VNIINLSLPNLNSLEPEERIYLTSSQKWKAQKAATIQGTKEIITGYR